MTTDSCHWRLKVLPRGRNRFDRRSSVQEGAILEQFPDYLVTTFRGRGRSPAGNNPGPSSRRASCHTDKKWGRLPKLHVPAIFIYEKDAFPSAHMGDFGWLDRPGVREEQSRPTIPLAGQKSCVKYRIMTGVRPSCEIGAAKSTGWPLGLQSNKDFPAPHCPLQSQHSSRPSLTARSDRYRLSR